MIFKGEMFIKYNILLNAVGKKFVINNEKINNRKNIILLGDIFEDITMVENVDYNNLISIAFLNHPINLKV